MELVKALTETSSLLTICLNESELRECLIERSCYETGSDIALLYEVEGTERLTPVNASHGPLSDYSMEGDADFVDFLEECGDYVVSHRGEKGPFPSLLAGKAMNSAAACPLLVNNEFKYLLVLNGRNDFHYTQNMLTYLGSVCRVAQNALTRLKGQET